MRNREKGIERQGRLRDKGGTVETKLKSKGGDLKDGGRVRRGDHIPPHRYIRNTSTCGTTPTEHLQNAGRRPQTSQKSRNSPHTG